MFTDKLQSFALEARLLIENHRQLLVESPSAFRPLLIRQLRSWEGLFPPERESLAWMISALARQTAEQRQGLFKNIEAIQLPELADLDLLFDEEKLLERCLRHFKKNGTYQTWRLAVDDVFQILTAGFESQRSSRPKLVMAILGEGTGRAQTVEDSDQRYLSYFWNHLQPLGTLFARIDGEPGDRFACAPLFTLFRKHLGMPQIRTWAIETGTELKPGNADHAPTWFSFEHLKPVMERVTRKMADEMLAGVTGPEALYAKMTDFKMDELGLPDYDDPRIRKFIEQVIVSGSGALVINNSFAEWTALQALRRVEPDLLVVRFGDAPAFRSSAPARSFRARVARARARGCRRVAAGRRRPDVLCLARDTQESKIQRFDLFSDLSRRIKSRAPVGAGDSKRSYHPGVRDFAGSGCYTGAARRSFIRRIRRTGPSSGFKRKLIRK